MQNWLRQCGEAAYCIYFINAVHFGNPSHENCFAMLGAAYCIYFIDAVHFGNLTACKIGYANAVRLHTASIS